MTGDHRHDSLSTALVTGGASGIGRGLSLALAEAGITVVVADRQADLAATVVADITRHGGSARAAPLDVRNPDEFRQVVASIAESGGRLDYLFNNAGVGVLGDAAHFSAADWSDVLAVNLLGVCNGIAAAYPLMVQQRSGHIMNTASIAGLVPAPLAASYTASKFGIVGLSRALRIEAARHGVRVSVLCPFIIDTPLLEGGRYGRVNDDVSSLRRQRMLLRSLAVPPQGLARRVLRQMRRNRAVIVYPSWARLLWHLDRVSPWLSERVTATVMTRLME